MDNHDMFTGNDLRADLSMTFSHGNWSHLIPPLMMTCSLITMKWLVSAGRVSNPPRVVTDPPLRKRQLWAPWPLVGHALRPFSCFVVPDGGPAWRLA